MTIGNIPHNIQRNHCQFSQAVEHILHILHIQMGGEKSPLM